MDSSPDPWGPYRETVEEHLAACADYLGRLRRSLDGEISTDRHYFADKAHQLHTSARRMVRTVQDVERWLGECGTPFEYDHADGTRAKADCALPAGHPVSHLEDREDPVAGIVSGQLRDLADAAERASHEFGWKAPAIDRDRLGAPGTVANSDDALDNLATSLDTIGRRARALAGHVRDATLDPIDHRRPTARLRALAAPRAPTIDSPSVEL